MRSRIVGGLMFILPLAITFIILRWLYELLRDLVIVPVIRAALDPERTAAVAGDID